MAVSKEKIKKLIKLGDLLSASFTLEEAYGVIVREMSHLFPAGAFFRYDEQKNLLEPAADETESLVLVEHRQMGKLGDVVTKMLGGLGHLAFGKTDDNSIDLML